MSWRDKLQRASFRGVEFHVETVDTEFGRRRVVHEYFGQDLPYVEDTGRAARSTLIDAYLVGADHIEQSEQLIAAVEKRGPGELVHPFYGIRSGICSLKVRQSLTSDGGMTKLQITFDEDGGNEFPRASISPRASLDASSLSLSSLLADRFASVFSLAGAASYVVDAADSVLSLANSSIEDRLLSLVSSSPQGAPIARAIRRLSALAAGVRNDPLDYAVAVSDVLRSVSDAADARAGGDALLDLGSSFGADLPQVSGNTFQRDIQRQNQQAVIELVRDEAITQAARSIMAAEWMVYDDAVEARDSVLHQIDERQLVTQDDDVYRALAAVRVDIAENLPPSDQQLPSLTDYTPHATEPALVSAYRLYADANRGDEIAERNRVPNPGFLPGGQRLEVLTDG